MNLSPRWLRVVVMLIMTMVMIVAMMVVIMSMIVRMAVIVRVIMIVVVVMEALAWPRSPRVFIEDKRFDGDRHGV